MTNPIIGYHNQYRDAAAVVSASSDPAAAPKENAIDWRLEDFWQPAAATSHDLDLDAGSAKTLDYLAYYSSDLYPETGAKVELFSGASSPAATLRATITPTSVQPQLVTFSGISARYWRIRFSTTASFSPKIQIANAGAKLELQRGLRPGYESPFLAPDNRPKTNISEQGFFIGRSVRPEPIDFRLSTTVLTAAWVRANWFALRTHIVRRPFFLLAEPDDYPLECVIAWTRGVIKPPRYTHAAHLALDLNLRAFR